MEKKIARTISQEEYEKNRKQDIAEAKIKHNNHNIGMNALVIRECYTLVAKKAGIPNATKNLYDYLKCTPSEYDKLVSSTSCSKSIIEGLIALGVPANCMRTDHATLLKMSDAVEQICYDYSLSDKKDVEDTPLKNFRQLLEINLLTVPDKENLFLLTIASQMVKMVYNAMETPTDRVADFFSALAEIDIDGSDFKQKDLFNELVSIAESYVDDEVE